MRRGAGLIVAALAGWAGPPALAQDAREGILTVELRRDSAGTLLAPRVRASRPLGAGVFDAALRNGFPVQLHFRLDLYRDAALFDRLERSIAWDVIVRLDPLANTFDIVRTGGTVENAPDTAALARALEVPFTVDLLPAGPPGRSRFYYLATLDIESLSLTELEEVERWLRGELEPAVREGGDVGDALGRGARRLLIRFSGLPRRHLEGRTPTFQP